MLAWQPTLGAKPTCRLLLMLSTVKHPVRPPAFQPSSSPPTGTRLPTATTTAFMYSLRIPYLLPPVLLLVILVANELVNKLGHPAHRSFRTSRPTSPSPLYHAAASEPSSGASLGYKYKCMQLGCEQGQGQNILDMGPGQGDARHGPRHPGPTTSLARPTGGVEEVAKYPLLVAGPPLLQGPMLSAIHLRCYLTVVLDESAPLPLERTGPGYE